MVVVFLNQSLYIPCRLFSDSQRWASEVGKVTLKSNGDEALSNESLLKSKGDEALNDDFS